MGGDEGSGPKPKPWKVALLVVPALAFVGVLTAATLGRATTPGVGDAAPDFEAPYLVGSGSLRLSSLRGTPVVLNFWASWCEPCKDEAPMLRRAHALYGDDVAIVGIDIRDAIGDAEAFVARYDLDYLHVRDERLEVYSDYGLTGQPETFFIDDEGTIVEHVPGPLFEDDLMRLLDILVARDQRA